MSSEKPKIAWECSYCGTRNEHEVDFSGLFCEMCGTNELESVDFAARYDGLVKTNLANLPAEFFSFPFREDASASANALDFIRTRFPQFANTGIWSGFTVNGREDDYLWSKAYSDNTQLIMVMVTAVLASVGTAGIPGSGLVMLTIVLNAVNLPLETIALLAGIDRILNMARVIPNIVGDAAVAVMVAKSEGELGPMKEDA